LKKSFDDVMTDVNGNNNVDVPLLFLLSKNCQNTFNPNAVIKYSIPVETMHAWFQQVILKVYDVLDREVVALVNEVKPAGNYEVKFEGANLPSGIYFYRLQAGDFVQTKKMVLLK
jgi:hypothetical protein